MNKKTAALFAIAQKTKNWESFLLSFSPQQQGILQATGNKTVTPDQVARRLMRSPRSISTQMAKMSRDSVLVRIKIGTYAVPNKDFASYLETSILAPLDKEDVATEASTTAYQAMAPFFEALEHQGLIVGNGHHIAQSFAQKAKDTVLEEWRGKPKN